MAVTDGERREAAGRLRAMCAGGCRYAEQFYELLNETVMDAWDFHGFQDVADRLADLIDPDPGQTADVARETAARVREACGEVERWGRAASWPGPSPTRSGWTTRTS